MRTPMYNTPKVPYLKYTVVSIKHKANNITIHIIILSSLLNTPLYLTDTESLAKLAVFEQHGQEGS